VAGTLANFERREQGWKHQKDLAAKDVSSLQKDVAVADLRKSIATRSLELHEKS
jgi:hypothetical protein